MTQLLSNGLDVIMSVDMLEPVRIKVASKIMVSMTTERKIESSLS